jgi:cell division septum initiation protein DivIVA
MTSTRRAEDTRRALVPAVDAFLVDARADVARVLGTAEADAQQVLGAARAEADRILDRARAQGRADAEHQAQSELRRARRAARHAVLAAQRASYDELVDRCAQRLTEARGMSRPAARDLVDTVLTSSPDLLQELWS